MRSTTISSFLTTDEIHACQKLQTAKKICEAIIQPNIQRINQKLGQENDPMYLAYAVEYTLSAVRYKRDGLREA